MQAVFVRNWWALALRGIVAILFGLAVILWPRLALYVLVLFFGAYSLIDGIFAVITAFGDRKAHEHWWVLLLEGLVGIVIGIITFLWPAITALALLYLIAAWAIVTGALEIGAAIRMSRIMRDNWLLIVGGIASILFGLILAFLPGVGILALLWLIAVYAIIFGIILLVLAFRVRRLAAL